VPTAIDFAYREPWGVRWVEGLLPSLPPLPPSLLLFGWRRKKRIVKI